MLRRVANLVVATLQGAILPLAFSWWSDGKARRPATASLMLEGFGDELGDMIAGR